MGCGSSVDDGGDRKGSARSIGSGHIDTDSTRRRELDQVSDIRARRPKQNILSTDAESMTHYKTTTFYIDDEDNYYESAKKVVVHSKDDPDPLKRTNSVLRKSGSSNNPSGVMGRQKSQDSSQFAAATSSNSIRPDLMSDSNSLPAGTKEGDAVAKGSSKVSSAHSSRRASTDASFGVYVREDSGPPGIVDSGSSTGGGQKPSGSRKRISFLNDKKSQPLKRGSPVGTETES